MAATLTFTDKLTRAKTLEDKLWAIHNEFHGIPVRITYDPWDGFEIRLTQESSSVCYGPMKWKINVDDVDLLNRLSEVFKHIDYTMIGILNKVWGYQNMGIHIGFMEEVNIDDMIARWKRFNEWMSKHFPEYASNPLERKFDWESPEGLPKNTIAWGARCILYGIKPSKTGITLFKEGKVDVHENGVLTLKKDSGLETRWHFKKREERKDTDPSEIDSFGVAGALSACFSKAFTDDKDIISCNKIPEQWEVDANVYIGLQKKGLKRFV